MGRGVRLRYIKRKTVKGRRYVYFERPGHERVRLPDLPENHPAFLTAYSEAADRAAKLPSIRATKAGSLGAVIEAYKASTEWRALADGTRTYRARILDKLRDKAGDLMIAALREGPITKDLRGLSPNVFNTRLAVWQALIARARADGLIAHDPAAGLRKRKIKTEGHHTWTLDQIEAFRERHPCGSQARLVLELAYWTGARRSDLVRLGPQMVDREGWLKFTQDKTEDSVEIPLTCQDLPPECAGLEADHAHLLRALEAGGALRGLIFVRTNRGTARSSKAFGAWFRDRCAEAGLPVECTLHGLRKARATDLANRGWGDKKIGAWTGHKSASALAPYTRKADRRRMLGGVEREQNMGKPVIPFPENGGKSSRNKEG